MAQGSGIGTSVGDLLDKEYVTAWGDGNAMVTFGDFRLGQKGALESARIYSTVTHDAGATWTTPVLISGDALFAFVSTPIATADGRIFVAYEDFTHFDNGRDDYAVAELDPDTGRPDRGPVQGRHPDRRHHRLPDRARPPDLPGLDLPLLVRRQHRGRSHRRRPPRRRLVGHAQQPAPRPGKPVRGGHELRHDRQPVVRRRADLVRRPSRSSCRATSSRAGARTTPTGLLRIGFFDRQYDAANHQYGYTLATETSAGSLSFSTDELTTVRSDPTKNNRWFAATLDPDFPFATSFIGDYSGIAATPSGGVVAVWTDLRNQVSFAGGTGADEDVYFATSP